jgi:hypothetical protein
LRVALDMGCCFMKEELFFLLSLYLIHIFYELIGVFKAAQHVTVMSIQTFYLLKAWSLCHLLMIFSVWIMISFQKNLTHVDFICDRWNLLLSKPSCSIYCINISFTTLHSSWVAFFVFWLYLSFDVMLHNISTLVNCCCS